MVGKSSLSLHLGLKKGLLLFSIVTLTHWQSSSSNSFVEACSDSYLYFLYATREGQIKAVNKDSNSVMTVLETTATTMSSKIGGVTTKVRGDNLYYCTDDQVYLGDYFHGGEGKLLVDMKEGGGRNEEETEAESALSDGECTYLTFDTSFKRNGDQEDILYVMDKAQNIYYIENFDTTVAESTTNKITPTKVIGLSKTPTLNQVEVHNGHLYYASHNTLVRGTRKGHSIQLYQTDNEILSTTLHPSESVIYYMEAGVGVWALNFKQTPYNPILIYETDQTSGITLSGDTDYTVKGRGPFSEDPNLYIFDSNSLVITAVNMNTQSTLSSESLVEGHEDIKIMMDINSIQGLGEDIENYNNDNEEAMTTSTAIPYISTFGMGCCTCDETLAPTPGPSASPTSPTAYPTEHPTKIPTPQPSNHPTPSPTSLPTHRPSGAPTEHPTKSPTEKPTKSPTPLPTSLPTALPTEKPSAFPTSLPTGLPTSLPSSSPTPSPTMHPTKSPTPYPTEFPTAEPTESPTGLPSTSPTSLPTTSPTTFPTSLPTTVPTAAPTQCDTVCYHELYEITDTFDMLQAKVTKLHEQEEEKLHRMLKESSLSVKMNSIQSNVMQDSTSQDLLGIKGDSETANANSSIGHSPITFLITTFSSIMISFFVGTVIEKLRHRSQNTYSNMGRV